MIGESLSAEAHVQDEPSKQKKAGLDISISCECCRLQRFNQCDSARSQMGFQWIECLFAKHNTVISKGELIKWR